MLTVDISLPDVEELRKAITRLASRASGHAGQFRRVELVGVDSAATANIPTVPLPRLAKDDRDAAACADANDLLGRQGVTRRWVC